MNNTSSTAEDEIKTFAGKKHEDILISILMLIKDDPRGLTISDIAEEMKLNRNTIRKYTLMLTAGGYIEERTCGHTKVFNISNRIPLTGMIEFTFEGVLVLDQKGVPVYKNRAVTESLMLKNIDISMILSNKLIKDALEKAPQEGMTDLEIEYRTEKNIHNIFSVRVLPVNSFNGDKMTALCIEKKKEKNS
ncbi:helix-turn-helix domain-containing protein [Methanochimaera problematica]|uniref:helix-turn-helix domain-containing protein n=1 Tax=Methanochimaera problematica TaxID=2609417 RepID=UPI00293943FC|nr:helix-turn-helix domain-containing protein [Methanoplanus sp. FWC-SCC4]